LVYDKRAAVDKNDNVVCEKSFTQFFWYVIGFKNRNLDYTQIWNTKQKWNLILPFFSYRGKRWEFYIGWRPDTRALGIALRRRHKI